MAKKKGPTRDASAANPEATSKILKAVADLDRLRIIHILRGGARNVSQLANALGAEIVNVSHHLSVLRESRIVHHQKKGRYVIYTLHPNVYQKHGGTEVLEVNNVRLEILK
jgi:DNA-binding transcriptional ArsR family regulator